MMSVDKSRDTLEAFVSDYCENAEKAFESRWSQIKPAIYEKHTHEVIGALLARQVTLSIEMAQAPQIWTGDIAPLVLRCMTDAYITLAWILEDPADRSLKYVHYGLGQEKLYLEYLEEEIRESPDGSDVPQLRELIEIRRSWLNGQLADWATEVNVGSWSGISTYEMAKAIGRESIYRFAYVPWSGPAHNMWQHVGIYNVKQCLNPLHKFHFVPAIYKSRKDPDFMYRSAKYLTQTFEVFDRKMGITSDVPMPIQFFHDHPFFASSDEGEAAR
jgi:hypothetical protein